jgi:hypothetical protein
MVVDTNKWFLISPFSIECIAWLVVIAVVATLSLLAFLRYRRFHKMTDNLSTPLGNSSDKRPHQTGKAIGTNKWFVTSSISIEWLVDTGAEIACITSATANNFRLKNTGGSASATTGGGGILIKSGLTTEFEVIDKSGTRKNVQCSLDVGVKPNNAGSEILGMDQIENVNAIVEWEPKSGKGRIRL